MALVGNDFYVANSDAIMKFPYRSGDHQITARRVKLVDLPGRPAQPSLDQGSRRLSEMDRSSMTTVGSNSNVGENGMEVETIIALPFLKVDQRHG